MAESKLPADLGPSDKVALILHSIDTVWRAWQYQLDRAREFMVLLSALAGGLFALFAQARVTRGQVEMATGAGALLAFFWSFLNHRWAKVIRALTEGLHTVADDMGMSACHPYLKGPFGALEKPQPGSSPRRRLWWTQGTMALSLVYLGFYLILMVYFSRIDWPQRAVLLPKG